MFNHEPLEAQRDGLAYVWQLDNLAPIEDEDARPSITALAPRVSVSYHPAGNSTELGPSFREWGEVSSWFAKLSDPQAVADATVKAKSAELVAGASGELDKIEAIAKFAQRIRYVSIQIGAGRGGGYTPHKAADILAKSYGDCKDKTILMRSLLAEAGIDSWAVSVYSGDRNYVRPEWPSPHQFNHVILAAKAPAGYDSSAVAEVDGYGRLLLFDPTDPYTAVGHLPEDLQNSLGLLKDAAGGPLFRLPQAPPSENRLERKVAMRLEPTGAIHARITESCAGDSASHNRRLYRSLSEADYRKVIERWITTSASGVSISKIEVADEPGEDFQLDVMLEAPAYARSMMGRMLVFRPALVSRGDTFLGADDDRTYPAVISGRSYSEDAVIDLPDGFAVDELPQGVRIETEFGSYQAEYLTEPGRLTFRRKLEVRAMTVPPEEYAGVAEFYTVVRGAENAPVVLVRAQ